MLPLLKASTQGRIITVTSYSHRTTPLVISRLTNPWPYIGLLAYKRSKLCNILFSYKFNRVIDKNFLAVAFDPGLVNTGITSKGGKGISYWAWRLLKQKNADLPDVPAVAITYISGVEKIDTSRGYYYINCKPQIPSIKARNEQLAEKLRQLSCELTKINW